MMDEQPKLLLIDDEPSNLILMINVLEYDYDVRVAKSGYQAMDMIEERPLPDLILLDIQMPGMDGFEVLRRLQSNDVTKDIPVIFVTARTDIKYEELAFTAGVVDYITKPINPAIVKARVKTQLENKFEKDDIKKEQILLERDLLYSQSIGKIGSWKFDLINEKIMGTPEFYRLLGSIEKSMSLEELRLYVFEDDRPLLDKAWNDAIDGNIYKIQYRTSASEGTKWIFSHGKVDYDGDTPVTAYGIIQDITEIKEYEKKIENVAYCNLMTGLPNRYSTERWVEKKKNNDNKCVLYAIDLDELTKINNSMGVDIGDKVITVIAERLETLKRENVFVSHIAGDKFMITVCTDINSDNDNDNDNDIIALVHHIRMLISMPIYIDDDEIIMTACISTVEHTDSSVSTGLLMRMSDHSLYLAKIRQKNSYINFDMSEYNSNVDFNKQINEIKRAFYDNQFILYYQPKINLFTNKLLGLEALIRWNKPDVGVVGPYAFIPLIEDHPLMVEVGDFVIDVALSDLNKWKKAGINTTVSVNISTNQFQHPLFIDKLHNSVMKFPLIDIKDVDLEILESGPLINIDSAMSVFSSLREMKGVFSLDDFGVGHSSLQTLQIYKPNFIKIDKSFVIEMLNDQDKYTITKVIVMLGKNFNLNVIAEGVESQEHITELKKLGCVYGQGFGIAKPMPVSCVVDWINEWNKNENQ